MLLDALRKHAEGHIAKHKANVLVYLNNPVGVGEHPDIIDTMEKEILEIAKYKDVIEELTDFFRERIDFVQKKGVSRQQVLIDPGVGFGKRREDNLKIINELYKLKVFGLPIFLGLSRKSFIGQILNFDVAQRLTGTIAASVVSLLRGACIVRVHDVREAVEAVRVTSQIVNN